MKHEPFTHEHPARTVALRMRTRLFGTLNLAVALSGRSCGWGSCERPRRTFVARVPRRTPDTGLHFVELVMNGRALFRLGDARPESHVSEEER
jgi:hypothetical protein